MKDYSKQLDRIAKGARSDKAHMAILTEAAVRASLLFSIAVIREIRAAESLRKLK